MELEPLVLDIVDSFRDREALAVGTASGSFNSVIGIRGTPCSDANLGAEAHRKRTICGTTEVVPFRSSGSLAGEKFGAAFEEVMPSSSLSRRQARHKGVLPDLASVCRF